MESSKYALAVLPLVATVLLGCFAEPDPTIDEELLGQTEQAANGNGAPSGAHYNLNLIGVPKNKTADMTGNNGGRIFMPLWGKSRILLSPGNDFQVLDANGTDGEASFQLPDDVAQAYQVYIRALGTPGGGATMQTCATDPATGEELCSTTESGEPIVVELRRSKGKSVFTNVTSELTTVCTTLGTTGTYGCYDLFSEEMYDYLWTYDNKGLKVAQMRFYPN